MPEGITITNRELYDELRKVHSDVQDIRAEVKSIADHETRLRALERKLWIASGAATALGAALGVLITALARVLIGA